jgi:hypothetical protein
MKLRFSIMAACAGMLALAQNDLAQAAYPGSGAPKGLETNADAEMGVNFWAGDHQIIDQRVAQSSRKCGTSGTVTCKRQHAPPPPPH